MARPLGSPTKVKVRPKARKVGRGIVHQQHAQRAAVKAAPKAVRHAAPVIARQAKVENRKVIRKAKKADRGQHDRQREKLTLHYRPRVAKVPTQPSGFSESKPRDFIPQIHVPKGVSRFGVKAVVNGVFGAKAADTLSKSKVGKKALKFTENNTNDLLNMTANAPASVALALAHPKKTVSEFPDKDPVGRLIFHGDPKLVLEHPAVAAVEIAGLKSAAGNTAGRAARSGVAGKTVKRAASTKRPNLKLYDGVENGPEVARRYSGDVIQKALQVGNEARKARKGQDPHVARGRRQRRLIKKRTVDELAVTEGRRRTAKGVESRKADAPMHKSVRIARKSTRELGTEGMSRAHAKATPFVVEGRIRTPNTAKADIDHEIARLQAQDTTALSKRELDGHRQQLSDLTDLSQSDKFLKNPQPSFDAAVKINRVQVPRTTVLQQKHLLKPEDEGARYVPYAVTHMGAKPSKEGLPEVPMTEAEHATETGRLQGTVIAERTAAAQHSQAGSTRQAQTSLNRVKAAEKQLEALQANPGSRQLKVPEIQAHMRASDTREPGFFSQKPVTRGRYYVAIAKRDATRPKINRAHRTGESSRLGTYEATPKALVAQASHEANVSEAAQGFDRLQSHFTIKPKEGHWQSYQKASQAADEFGPKTGLVNKEGDTQLVPMNVGRLKAVQDLLDSAVPEERALEGLSDRVRESFTDSGPGQYVLAPRQVKDLLLQSIEPRGSLERQLQNVTRVWKDTVLSTSTKWLAGNVVDVGVRSVVGGVGPLDVVRGAQVMKGLRKADPDAAASFQERALGGNFYAGTDRLDTFKEPNGFSKLPPIRMVRAGWRGYKNAVFGFNTAIEKSANYGALGRAARKEVRSEAQSIQDVFAVGEKAFDQFIDGLTRTPEQVRVADSVEAIYGRWGKLSPGAKKFLVHAPFVQWLGVATKFVFWTLPKEHPIKAGILASLSQLTEDERKALGLNIDLFHNDPNAVRDYQQGNIPKGKDQLRPFARYSSFGIATDPTSLPDFLYPQLSSSIKAFGGIDWKDQQLKNPDGSELTKAQRMGLGVYILGEGLFPFAGPIRRVREKGGVSASTSTVFKPRTIPGTAESVKTGLDKVFNPARPLKVSRQGGAKAGDDFENFMRKQKSSGPDDFEKFMKGLK